MITNRLIPGVALLLLSACSAGVRLPTSETLSSGSSEAPASPQQPPAGDHPTRTLPPPSRDETPALPLSPAALTLLAQAEVQRQQKQVDAAAATVERALRLAPVHPEPWLVLASIRVEQHRAEDAEGLARRALSLGGGIHAVRQRAWTLIAQARQLRGDAQGAAEARMRAGRD